MYSIRGFPLQDTYKVSYPSEKKMGNNSSRVQESLKLRLTYIGQELNFIEV